MYRVVVTSKLSSLKWIFRSNGFQSSFFDFYYLFVSGIFLKWMGQMK